jgi:hypothetical protein
MASRSIGSIYASLYLRDKDFSKGLKKARADASSFNSTIASLAKNGLAAAGLSSPFVTMGAAIKSAIDQGGALQDMMTRTGAAGEGLVIMQTAFENAGLAAEMVPDSLNKMQKALAGVNEDGDQTAGVFAQLGLSAQELTAMDPAKAFEAIAKAISGIKDPATRTARAMDVFGKSGGKALTVLNDPNAFSQATTQVGGLGKTLAENAAALDNIGDSYGQLQIKVSQLAVGFTVGLIPGLEATAESLNKLDATDTGIAIGEYTNVLLNFASSLKGVTTPLDGFIAAYAAFKELTRDSKGTELPSNLTIGADGKLSKNDPIKQNPIERGPAIGNETLDKTIDMITKSIGPEMERLKARKEYLATYYEELTILNAKNSNDDVALKRLEKEKAIREEINKMIKAGFIIDQSSKDAAAKIVEARMAADATTQPDRRAVNSYQSRGLSLDGSPMKKTSDGMMPLLASIKDTLKAAQNGGFTLSW